MIKVLLVLLAAQAVPRATGAGSSPIDGKCKQANDYEKAACGVKDKSLTCCNHKQVCIGPIKPHKGDDKYVCSKERKLGGSKVMKIILIPLLFIILDILFIVFMAVKLDIKGNHVTKLCIGAIAVSWPLLLSSKSHFGIYAAFLSLLVAYMSNTDGFPRWVYRVIWAMLIFQIVLIFGPNEAFHVPVFDQSLAGKNSDLLTDIIKLTEADCDTHYESFFKIMSIEKTPTGANPDKDYYVFCTEEFIGFVQTMLMVQGLVWIVTALISARVFLTDGARSTPATKAASEPATESYTTEVKPVQPAPETKVVTTQELRDAAMVVEPVEND